MAIPDELRMLKSALEEIRTPYTPKAVFDVPPSSAPTSAQMPAFILFMRHDPKVDNSTYSVERRVSSYVAQLLVNPVGQGTLTTNYRKAIDLIEPTMDALWAHIKLFNTGTDGVQVMQPTHSRPYAFREHWSGQVYFGVNFYVDVQTWRVVNLGA